MTWNARPHVWAAGLVLLVAGALAANPLSASLVTEVPISVTSDTPSGPGSTRLEQAHDLAKQGRFDEARKQYALAAREQRAAGMLPTEALWHLAQMYHGESRTRRAADVLRTLAHDASVMGDPVVQARALLEATLLYAAAGDDDRVDAGIRQLGLLQASPFIPGTLRAEIDQRLGLG